MLKYQIKSHYFPIKILNGKNISLLISALLYLAIAQAQQNRTYQTPNKFYYPDYRIYTQYRGSVDTPLGIDLGILGYYSGMFMSCSTGHTFETNTADYNGDGNVVFNSMGDSLVNTGNPQIGRGNISVGYINRVHYNALLYTGAGYGWSHQVDVYNEYDDIMQTTQEVYVRNLPKWFGGIETYGGIIIDLHKITINSGLSILNMKKETLIWTWGFGFFLSR